MAKKFTLTFSQDVNFDDLTAKLTETGFGGALVVECDDTPVPAEVVKDAPETSDDAEEEKEEVAA